jgi:hypothetical protein
MPAHDPAERSRIARNAALRRHALGDPVEATASKRRSFLDGFARQVDEAAAARGEMLTPAERAKRTDRLLRAHMGELARRSAKARRAKAQTRGDPP